jgi:hypothetical protein
MYFIFFPDSVRAATVGEGSSETDFVGAATARERTNEIALLRSRLGKNRRAIVIIAVLALVVILGLLGYRYADLMTEQYRSATNVVRQVQSRSVAEAGVHYTAMLLATPDALDSLFDNRAKFFRQLIKETPSSIGGQSYFSVIATPWGDQVQNGSGQFTFGVIDEGSKININAVMKADQTGNALYELLLGLPNMSPDIAAAIVDFLDTDDSPRPDGAESSDYAPLYQARNGPLDSLDELLLVKGVTFELLYGGDRNRNGMIDADETPPDADNPLGWSQYLTVHSREQHVDIKYQARVNVNAGPLSSLQTALSNALSEEMVTYILLYRAYGGTTVPTSSSGSGGANKSSGAGSSTAGAKSSSKSTVATSLPSDLDLSKPPKETKIQSLYALINSQVTVTTKDSKSGNEKTSVYASPLNTDSGLQQHLPALLDSCKTSEDSELPARINLVTAPKTLIEALGQITQTQSDSSGNSSNTTSGNESTVTTVGGTTPTTISGGGAAKGAGGGSPASPMGGTASPKSAGGGSGMNPAGGTGSPTSGGSNSTSSGTKSNSSSQGGPEPVLTADDINQILAKRPAPGSSLAADLEYQTPAWLVTQAKLSPKAMQGIEKYVTSRSQVYRFQVVGYTDGAGPVSRVEAVVDINAGRPRILYFRDLSNLGAGFDLSQLK